MKKIHFAYKNRVLCSLIVSLALIATPLCFTSSMIFLGNALEFTISLRAVLSVVLPIAIVLWLGTALFLMVISQKMYTLFIALFTAFTLLFWLQSTILVWNYGVLDGSQIDWLGMWIPGSIDALIWITVLGASILFHNTLTKHALKFALTLMIIQSAALLVEIKSAPQPPRAHRYHLSESHKFSFSEEKNIIIIILDAFQADVMQEILSDNPEYNQVFDGFTFFRNASSAYSKTYATIPLLLTGEWYENDSPIQQFLEKSFTTSSITNNMMNAGWRVDLFPWAPRTIHLSESLADNIHQKLAPEELMREAGKALDLGLFRSVPHSIKPFFLNNYQLQFSRGFKRVYTFLRYRTKGLFKARHFHYALDFLINLSQHAQVSVQTPAFKMYHLPIPHEPFLLTENLETERLPLTRDGFVRHSVASLEVTRRLIDMLKELAIYDNSMLLVISDHGGGDYAPGVNYTTLPAHLGRPDTNSKSIADKHLESALPLILIKPFGESGALLTSDLPVSLSDIAYTISDEAGFNPQINGCNILKAHSCDNQTRRYLFYEFKSWDKQYLPVLKEYELYGHSWFPQNWYATGNYFRPESVEEPKGMNTLAQEYGRGDVLCFKGTTHKESLLYGWCNPETNGTWSKEKKAALNITFREPVDSAVEVSFYLKAFTAKNHFSAQTVNVIMEGELLDKWVVSSVEQRHTVVVPAQLTVAREQLTFIFDLPDATIAEFDLGLSLDTRNLGICLSRVEIR